MKKRLRKKKHLGEFAVYGISFRANFVPGLGDAEFDDFINGLIGLVEIHGLQTGGGGSRESGWTGVIEPSPGQREIPQDAIDALSAWLGVESQVADFKISTPWDVWHGQDPFAGPPQ